MSRAACTKYVSRVKRAMEMKNGNTLWVVMGKTSAWENEEIPAVPTPGDEVLVEPFLAIQPSVLSLAKEIILLKL